MLLRINRFSNRISVLSLCCAIVCCTLYLFGCDSTSLVTIPELRGLNRSEAEANLTIVGLRTGVILERASDNVPANEIMDQFPLPGVSVPRGSNVDLTVSLGRAVDMQALLDEAAANFLDERISIDIATQDLDALFWLIALESSPEEAIYALDDAMAKALDATGDLLGFVARNASAGPRLIDPELAAAKGWQHRGEKTGNWSWRGSNEKHPNRVRKQSSGDTTVFYINGVWNDYATASASASLLREALATEPGIRTALIFNPTGAADFQETVLAGLICPQISSWLPLLATVVNSLCDSINTIDERFIDLQEVLRQAVLFEVYGRLGDTTSLDDPTTRLIRNLVQSRTATGRGVILVPHSQGNFYVRDALNGIPAESRSKIAVVEAASPSRFMPQPSVRIDVCSDPIPYLSGRLDSKECFSYESLCTQVLNFLEDPIWLTVPADRTQTICLDAHDFIGSYMTGSSRIALIENVLCFRRKLLADDPSDLVCIDSDVCQNPESGGSIPIKGVWATRDFNPSSGTGASLIFSAGASGNQWQFSGSGNNAVASGSGSYRLESLESCFALPNQFCGRIILQGSISCVGGAGSNSTPAPSAITYRVAPDCGTEVLTLFDSCVTSVFTEFVRR